MRKVILTTTILIAFLFPACKKEKCYQCRIYDVYTYWVKGNDTIITIAGNTGWPIPTYPTSSGYEAVRTEYVWGSYHITRCGDQILYIQKDSCHFTN